MVLHRTDRAWRKSLYGDYLTEAATYQSVEYSPSPAATQHGAWITFPNGYRFRSPTGHSRSHVLLSPGSSQDTNGYEIRLDGTRPVYRRWTSPGGYGWDNFFTGNFIYRLDADPCGIPNILNSPRFVTDESNEAVTKSLNKIGDQKVNIGENLATLGQTARMFLNPVKSFLDLARKYRDLPVGREIPWGQIARMNYRELVQGRFGPGFAQRYLEYVYGFAPLMQDIYETSELMKSQAKAPLLMNGRAKASRSGSMPSSDYVNYHLEHTESWDSITFNADTRVTLWAKLKEGYEFTRKLSQLGLVNPQSLVWELVPFSFVIDWALPIGPVLSAMNAPAGLDFVGGSISRRVKASIDYSITGWPVGPHIVFTDNRAATGRIVYDGYQRNPIDNWPRPGLWYNEDPLGINRSGSDRIVKAMALAIAALPRSL